MDKYFYLEPNDDSLSIYITDLTEKQEKYIRKIYNQLEKSSARAIFDPRKQTFHNFNHHIEFTDGCSNNFKKLSRYLKREDFEVILYDDDDND